MDIDIKRQTSVAIENQPGRLGQIGRLLAEKGIHISAFSVIDNVEQAMVRLVTDDPTAARMGFAVRRTSGRRSGRVGYRID